MTSQSRNAEKDSPRRRSAHKKSRSGCRNCKLRRVKCDETRPNCKQCKTYGVSCNYDSKSSDLQVTIDDTTSMWSLQKPCVFINQPSPGVTQALAILFPSVISDELSSFKLGERSLDRFVRFQTRTVFSLAPEKVARVYQYELPRLACSNPGLMHMIQAVTAIHDRYIDEPSSGKLSAIETYHISMAISLLSRKLSSPIRPKDQDALWISANFLGLVSFASFEGNTPEQAWPLKAPDSSDLAWMRMAEGKKAVLDVVDPHRPEGVFHELLEEVAKFNRARSSDPIPDVPGPFVELFCVDDSTVASNPYHSAVYSISALLSIDEDGATPYTFFSFIMEATQQFKELVHQKDPRALLLMAYWYGKLSHSTWWIARRAILEGQATCMYLERQYPESREILGLLKYPKTLCGLNS